MRSCRNSLLRRENMSAEQSSTQPDPNANPATSPAADPAREENQLAQSLSASMGANMRRTANGDVDILHAIGGWRGLVESSLPAVAFLVLFTVTKELNLSLIAALAAAGVFTLIRLVQGSKLVSALTGLVGVAICAFAAYRTGNASDYFVVGFWTNGVYILAYLLSMLVRWPLMGLIFAVIRGEALSWRQNPVRLRQYMLATWIITVLMMLRLAVQVPLYFANNVEALGATRLIMGLPLYALGVWLAWRVSAPEEALVSEDPEALDAEETEVPGDSESSKNR
ncbi:ABC-type dipeptide/oligopeptide/nickel transport system, permease component [Rothia mucilaginosa DY-18]|uniref:ABC-type dipeptide/oligopeptide/nickel transport system, permease component n=2 Tax=Rothia mucilaginosa TaxID=43675 RepID=D2NTU7_ROTMD|nr:ABC-type dipeptide/oligopeptide/nickel transport system, permease component [Rothia mucilaginosa DY-18]